MIPIYDEIVERLEEHAQVNASQIGDDELTMLEWQIISNGRLRVYDASKAGLEDDDSDSEKVRRGAAD